MLKKKLLLLCFSLLLTGTEIFAQSSASSGDKIDPDNFSADAVIQPILAGINTARWNSGVDSVLSNDILTKAAKDLADEYNKDKKVSIEPGFAGQLVKKYKGTTKVEEASVDISAGKGKDMLSYSELANDILDKMIKGKKFESIVKNPKYYFCGLAASINSYTKKVYVSAVFGGVDAFNNGTKDRKKLPIRYTKGKKGLDPFDTKFCKACDKYPDLDKLSEHIYISGRYVYLEFYDFKKFKKYFHNSDDGLAVDLITREQYPCGGENIIDHNLSSKGFLMKPMYKDKLISKNLNTKDDPKNNTYKAAIGKIKKKYVAKLKEGDYEINLMYIYKKTVCRVMTHNYLEEGGANELVPLNIYPDTINSTDPKRFVPHNEDQVLPFTIYFEQGKSNYDTKDIKGFIDALKEPRFIVNEITIDAHSSLEGDSIINTRLQQERAKSIVDALEKFQGKKIAPPKITVSDSWDMFQDSIQKTDNKDMASMTKQQVKAQLNGATLTKLEPVLAKERFALITMKVTYDIKGKSEEEAFVVNTYRKAIDKKDYEGAKRISRYIVEQIDSKRYEPKPFLDIKVPEKAAFGSVLINRLYIDNKYNHDDTLSVALSDTLDNWYKTMSANDFIAWNKYMAFVKTGILVDTKTINEVQGKINDLYNKTIPQRLNDGLNLEWQFKVMEKVDTLDPGLPNPALQACMDRIKKIFNLTESNWQNSLKLAYIFEKHGDLAYAMKLLAPYVTGDKPDEQLLFTYISIAAHFPDEIFSRNFRFAMGKARSINQKRYCALFGTPNLSFQIMDNPIVKKQFCDTCGGNN